MAHDHVAQRAAQVRDVGVHRRSVVRGGVLAVHGLQQPVDRHRPSGRGDEDGEHGSLLGSAHELHLAVVGDDVQRAEYAIPHG